jgi:N-methylhydantoinase B/oxoprolinase/acetone carboxylase alpha subunit
MVCVKVGEASCRGGYDPQRGEYYTYYETIAGGPGSQPVDGVIHQIWHAECLTTC